MHNKLCFGLLVSASMILASGCSAKKVQLPPQTATSLVDLRHALATGQVRLMETSTAVEELANNPRSNVERQIKLISDSMVDLDREVTRIDEINTKLQARSDEHFAAWQQELKHIKNPDIAAAGQERKDESQATMVAIRSKLEEAASIVDPYMGNLRDINRYLQQDATIDGVKSLLPTMQKTLRMKSRVHKQLDDLIRYIDQVTRSVE